MEPELVTVFRSADHAADLQAEIVRDLLEEAGLSPEIFGDDAPGVPAGVFEVRVPAGEAGRADEIVAANQARIAEPGDDSHALDLVTVFSSDAHNADMEAMSIRGILDSSGIPSLIVGAPMYPNLPVEVRVPLAYLEDARRIIMAAQSAAEETAGEAAEPGGENL